MSILFKTSVEFFPPFRPVEIGNPSKVLNNLSCRRTEYKIQKTHPRPQFDTRVLLGSFYFLLKSQVTTETPKHQQNYLYFPRYVDVDA